MPNNLISTELSQQLIRDDCRSFNIRKDDGWKEFVAIVRCKDCRFWHAEGQYCDRFGVLWDEFYTSPNDYCSRGERREDGLLVTD